MLSLLKRGAWAWGPALLAALAFSAALPGGFLMIDDDWLVSENPWVLRAGWEDIRTILDPLTPRYEFGKGYLPLRDLSYCLDVWIWRAGSSALGLSWPLSLVCHLSQSALYALDAFLVAVLVTRLTGRRAWACLAGAVFALHPVHAEAVCWIASRKDLLGTACVLASTLAWRGHWAAGGLRQALLYLAAWLSFGAALLCKVPMAVLPGLLLLLDLFFPPGGGRWGWRLLPRLLPFFLLAVPILALQIPKEHGDFVVQYPGIGRLERALTMARVAMGYLGLLFWPLRGWVNYRPGWSESLGASEWGALAGLLLLGLLLGLTLLAAFRGRLGVEGSAAGLGLAWAAAALLPSSQLVVPSAVLMADRYLYLPSVGLALAAAVGLDRLLRGATRWALPGTFLLLLCWGLRDLAACAHWRDSRGMAGNTLRQDPRNQLLRSVLARVEAFEGRWEPARRRYLEAEILAGVPHEAPGVLVLAKMDSALALAESRGPREALGKVEEALQAFPNHFKLLALRGRFLWSLEDREASERAYALCTRVAPWADTGWLDLGICFHNQQRFAEAALALERAGRLAPPNAPLRCMQGLTLIALGRHAEAEALLREAEGLVQGTGVGHRALCDLRLALSRAALETHRDPARFRGLVLDAEAVLGPTVETEVLLAEWARASQDPVSAERHLRRAVALRRETGALRLLGEALRERGVRAALSGDAETAYGAYREALAVFPSDVDASGVKAHLEALEASLLKRRFEGAATAFEAGDLETARRGFRAALEIEPGFFEAAFNLGLVLARLGSWDEAARAFRAACAAREGDFEAWLRLGDACRESGEEAQALQAFERAKGLAATEGQRRAASLRLGP